MIDHRLAPSAREVATLLERIGRSQLVPVFGGLPDAGAEVKARMGKKTGLSGGSRASSRRVELPPAFAVIAKRFMRDRRVTFGGQGFGSRALRLDGKIFAMISRRGQFVVKLPRDRVAELIERGRGEYFDTGRSLVMKEWIAILAGPASWRELAEEAHRFALAKRTQLRESPRRRRRG